MHFGQQFIQIFPIFCPTDEVVLNVLPSVIQFPFITDNMVIITSLPHLATRRVAQIVDAPCHQRFEIAHHRTD